MITFIEAAQLGDIPLGKSVMVKVANKEVALFNVDGTIYAIDDSCAHAGSSLSAGELKAGTAARSSAMSGGSTIHSGP
jgi:nitrite reductase/ring-hydroxylating ferredoxin subunit